MQKLANWLENLGMSEYVQRFAENHIEVEVVGELTDADFDRLGISIGHRRKLLKALAAGVPAAAELLLGKSAIESDERRQVMVGSTSSCARMDPEDLRDPSSVSRRLRPAQMIEGGLSLQMSEALTLLPIASDDRRDCEVKAAQSGEYDDFQSTRWRDRLVVAIAVLGLAGLGSVGAFAYRPVFSGAVLPTLSQIVKAENGPNKKAPNDRLSHSRRKSKPSAGSSEKFVSRWPADNQEPPKTAPISPSQSAAPHGRLGFAVVAPIATAPAALPAAIASPARLAASTASPALAPTPISRSDLSYDPSADGAKRSAAAVPLVGKPLSLAPAAQGDSTGGTPAAKPRAAARPTVANQPVSPVPDTQGRAAAAPPDRSRTAANTQSAETASSGGGYAVQVASERSAADAHAVLRMLQAKFPSQLGGRQPIVRRTSIGAEGVYYRATIGPFASMDEAAGACATLKAAGGHCLVETN
jgi:hypothetical protein